MKSRPRFGFVCPSVRQVICLFKRARRRIVSANSSSRRLILVSALLLRHSESASPLSALFRSDNITSTALPLLRGGAGSEGGSRHVSLFGGFADRLCGSDVKSLLLVFLCHKVFDLLAVLRVGFETKLRVVQR